MINKKTRAIIVGNAKVEFVKLNEIVGVQAREGKKGTQEMKLLKSIKDKIELIKLNPFYGDNIKKTLIPKNMDVSNLWRVELNNFWRMLYSIKGDDVDIICFVLEITNHDKYNKILGYKK